MEILWLGGGNTDLTDQLIALDSVPLGPAQTIKSLGVILDSSLSMETQTTNFARLAFLLLHQAQQVASYLSCLDLATVIYATITFWLD